MKARDRSWIEALAIVGFCLALAQGISPGLRDWIGQQSFPLQFTVTIVMFLGLACFVMRLFVDNDRGKTT